MVVSGLGLCELDDHIGRNAAARREGCRQLHPAGLEHIDQVVQNSVRNVLIEDALIPKLLQIQFQTFQFDAKFIRNVLKRKCPKIRLSRFGANRRELWTNDFN